MLATPMPQSLPDLNSDSPSTTVFVGNLSYSSTQDSLKELFAVVGNTTTIRLITRYGKPKGFGFVTFATQDEAESAIAEFDQKDVDGRLLKVQLAVPRTKSEKPRKPKAEKRLDDVDSADVEAKDEAPKKPKRKPKKAFKKKANPEKTAESDENATSKSETEVTAVAADEKPVRKLKQKIAKDRKPREPRDPDAPLSETMVFVRNLPFEVEDKDLEVLFKPYEVKSAHVVRSRFGRSKGFGFVDFLDNETLVKVINEFNGALVNERPIIVKPAYADERAGKVDKQE